MVKACHSPEMARPDTEHHGPPVALTDPLLCELLEETRRMTVIECTARTVISSLVQTR